MSRTDRPEQESALDVADLAAAARRRTATRFTVCTLVSDAEHYSAMRESFERGGFTTDSTQYLFVDNTGPTQMCAYRGGNAMLEVAQGEFVILCHQDVRLLADDRETLEKRLAELERLDPSWALAGNAGGAAPGRLALRISDGHGTDQNTGNLPTRVMSLDENFIVVKRRARFGFSEDLSGFHFYGADLCLNADIAGWHAYVIDFHLLHLSGGSKGPAFYDCEARFRAKWSNALRARWMQTTCALVHLSGSMIGQTTGRLAEAPYRKLLRRLPRARHAGSKR